ncbi:hypothetical protein CEV31_2505 [Brucella thiophenivorans]|uniref:Uncharacterized protein n=1 Tax=Brucella thiophenivorans TaxID=571255 RepID=A0A256FWM7_9HYPH|nr:hypothetical protein CEV31_2505 [Brucella thiophenivorans]
MVAFNEDWLLLVFARAVKQKRHGSYGKLHHGAVRIPETKWT